MDVVVLVCRFLLAAVLVSAGVAKLSGRSDLERAIRGFGLLRPAWVAPAAVWLPRIELTCGLLLGLGVLIRPVAVVSGLLLVAFSVAIAVSLARGRAVTCGCFGNASARPVGLATLARAWALLAAAALVATSPPMALSLWPAGGTASVAAADAVAVLIGTVALLAASALLFEGAKVLRR